MLNYYESNFIDKNGRKRLSFLEVHVCMNFLSFMTSFHIVLKVEKILQLALNKIGYIASRNRRGCKIYNVNVDTR